MKIAIHAHHVTVTDTLKEYAEQKLEKLNRYFDNIQDIHVDLKVENVSNTDEQQVASATVYAAGTNVHAEEKSKTMYASIDGLEAKLATQLKRHKEKLRDNNRGAGKESGGSTKATIHRPEQRYIPKPLEAEVAAQICNDKKLDFLIYRDIDTERICVIHRTDKDAFEVIET